jgi:hypothetical protein
MKNKIRLLESKLQTPKLRKSKEFLEKILCDDFVEFSRSGKAINKTHTVEALKKESHKEYVMSNFKIHRISNNVIQATYKTKENKNGIEIKYTLRSSIWIKEGNRWKMQFHQATPIR